MWYNSSRKSLTIQDKTTGPLTAYEESELVLYTNSIIEDSGDHERALQHLEKIQPKVRDQVGWKVSKGIVLPQSCLFLLRSPTFVES